MRFTPSARRHRELSYAWEALIDELEFRGWKLIRANGGSPADGGREALKWYEARLLRSETVGSAREVTSVAGSGLNRMVDALRPTRRSAASREPSDETAGKTTG